MNQRTGKITKGWTLAKPGDVIRFRNDIANLTMTDSMALDTLRDLARRYTAVELTIADCGCHTVSLFADGVKIVEEDKVLGVAVENAIRKANK